jgi:hypothetical protein
MPYSKLGIVTFCIAILYFCTAIASVSVQTSILYRVIYLSNIFWFAPPVIVILAVISFYFISNNKAKGRSLVIASIILAVLPAFYAILLALGIAMVV